MLLYTKFATMLDAQTTKFLIGALFLFIAYTMHTKGDPHHVHYAFGGVGLLVVLQWFKNRGGGGGGGCL